MARIVQKFGGTSVADLERIRSAAQRVAAEVERGNNVAVVVSAMAGETNRLVELVSEAGALHDTREYDAVVSSGEQVTAGLLALCLHELGVPARSWLGWQIPIHTDEVHGRARITGIEPERILGRFDEGQVAVIAGFQGISPQGRIATLGRGGSDTTAVALAAALQAERCDIFTDVDGVYTSDPRIVMKARKLDKITYEEMLEMASLGAKVLQTRSVELAMNRGVRLQVLSSFEDKPGTLVVDEDEIVEQQVVSGIAYSRDEAKITLVQVEDRPGVAGADLQRAVKLLDSKRGEIEYKELVHDDGVVKVSVIGVGMRSDAGVAQSMFTALAEKGINIQVISTSEIKISVLIDEEYTELALRALHTAYGLDAD
jgi:aspartate kinase